MNLVYLFLYNIIAIGYKSQINWLESIVTNEVNKGNSLKVVKSNSTTKYSAFANHLFLLSK